MVRMYMILFIYTVKIKMSEVKRIVLYPDGQVKEESVYKDDKLVEVVFYLPGGNKVEQMVEYHDNGKMSYLIQVKDDNKIVQVFNQDEKLDGYAAYEEFTKGCLKWRLSYTDGKLGIRRGEPYLSWNYIEVTDDNKIYCDINEEGKLEDILIENGVEFKIDENGVVTSPDNLKGKFQFIVEDDRVVKKVLLPKRDLTSCDVNMNLLKLLSEQFGDKLEGVHKVQDKFVRVKLNSDKTLKKVEFL